jgi:hypothetical protein
MTRLHDGGMRAGVYIGCVATAGAGLVAWSLARIVESGLTPRLYAWSAVAVLTLLVGRLSIRTPVRGCRVSFSDAFLFLSIVVFGPAFATLTGAMDGLAASARRRGAWFKTLFNTGSMALSTHLSARLFEWAVPGGGLWGDPASAAADYLVPLVLVAAGQYALNTALVAGVLALREGCSFASIWHDTTLWSGTAYLLGAVSVGAAILVARELGMISFVALIPFPAIVYITYRSWLGRPVSDGKGE